MCLLVVAWQAHSRYRLVVAANRDEFHDRPTAPMAKWPGAPHPLTAPERTPLEPTPTGVSAQPPYDILAGRDLRANGTWLALDRRRRFGVVTNFRDLQRPQPHAPSRGGLIPHYLSGDATPGSFLADLEANAAAYAGFNLLLADADSLWYASNRTARDGQSATAKSTDEEAPSGSPAGIQTVPTGMRPQSTFARALAPGVYGLSNQFLDTPWPKLRRVRREFENWLRSLPGSTDDLFAILEDRARVEQDEELPQTGLSAEWERILSAPFVLHSDYGTRSSTVLLLEHSGAFVLIERRFDRQGEASGESKWVVKATGWP